jgi:nucleotide-binding universal stress UspA family protein
MEVTMSYKRIMVPVDGSSTSKAGLNEALKLARPVNAALLLVNVMDEQMAFSSIEMAASVPAMLDSMRASGNRILKAAALAARVKGVKAQTALVESFGTRVADTLVKQAKRWRADIIVMGTHGRRGVNRLVMGSDADLVVRYAGVPVLLVHGNAARKK